MNKKEVLEKISKATGHTEEDVDTAFEKARENLNKLNNCKLHQFGKIEMKIGSYHRCIHCGGEMPLHSIVIYKKGYEAANGKEKIYEQ